MLADRDIRKEFDEGNLGISDYKDFKKQLQPASFDFHLGREFKVIKDFPIDDTGKTDLSNIQTKSYFDSFSLASQDFVLAHTKESIRLPRDIAGKVDGRSSFGRLGVTVHITAGFLDPGFRGQVTLEVANLSSRPISLKAGQRIGQFTFHYLTRPCEVSYDEKEDAKYQDQRGACESKFKGML